MAITRVKLSASTNGQAVGLTTLPTTLHTSTTGASTSDEIHIWVANYGSSTVTVTAYVGATGAGFPIEVPAGAGPYLISPGFFLASGLIFYASAGSAGSIYAYGFANRLTTGA